jgi:hypothetical protein
MVPAHGAHRPLSSVALKAASRRLNTRAGRSVMRSCTPAEGRGGVGWSCGCRPAARPRNGRRCVARPAPACSPRQARCSGGSHQQARHRHAQLVSPARPWLLRRPHLALCAAPSAPCRARAAGRARSSSQRPAWHPAGPGRQATGCCGSRRSAPAASSSLPATARRCTPLVGRQGRGALGLGLGLAAGRWRWRRRRAAGWDLLGAPRGGCCPILLLLG